ncbi:uncharacterized protein TrAtP1_011881 [Trichoderma atroviride]|uniref:uncharacterized protein n=1 Tax=Hypocrea atroviridis TaxID=63577 RepID=UPI00331F31AA|nr:hypothetical protein TrAtP1_011881 [Trichoderma atroviride]
MSSADPATQLDTQEQPQKTKKPLSCISCKLRKLKCDHEKPICTRCTKAGSECIYPEARRKPTIQRSNVKELEARLAQVEGYLKEATEESRDVKRGKADGNQDSDDGTKSRSRAATATDEEDVAALDEQTPCIPLVQFTDPNQFADQAESGDGLPFESSNFEYLNGKQYSNDELIDLSMSETLPPLDVIEELHECFFTTQYHYMPLIQSCRYYQAFYGGPMRKPPMCLQYAIWAMGALWHPKYDRCADVFYKRSRYYAEADEMRESGEYFITIAHAQAWALIACYEARAMLYTRAGMSCARCCRLVHMLGLNKIDSPDDDAPETLGPPQDWIELEERRRVFWVAFSCDAQSSMATGWPSYINSDDIMTRLPASEEAFISGEEEECPFLDDVMKGASYSGFSGSLVLNHLLKAIMRHVHLIRPSDRPEDPTHGEFWKRHRRLDNQLSTLFMFMPDKFRLPENLHNPLATYINLNFHACVICLHHVALEVIEKHGLGDPLRKDSRYLLKNAADEIASIVKMTSHRSSLFSNPLCAFSLYSATTVYVYLAKEDPATGINPVDMSNLELIVNAMEAIGRIHMVTCAFLQQACLDIDNNGLSSTIKIPALYQYRNLFGGPASNIPLLARSPISKHTQMSSPLPGRLPLGNPLGHLRPTNLRMTKSIPLLTGVTAQMGRMGITESFRPTFGAISRNLAPRPTDNMNKRKRDPMSSQAATNTDAEIFMAALRNGYIGRAPTSGDFTPLDRTNSPHFSFSPIGQGTGSEPGSSSNSVWPCTTGSDPGHNSSDSQQDQSHQPSMAWQLDDDMMAFTEGFSNDCPDANGGPQAFF